MSSANLNLFTFVPPTPSPLLPWCSRGRYCRVWVTASTLSDSHSGLEHLACLPVCQYPTIWLVIQSCYDVHDVVRVYIRSIAHMPSCHTRSKHSRWSTKVLYMMCHPSLWFSPFRCRLNTCPVFTYLMTYLLTYLPTYLYLPTSDCCWWQYFDTLSKRYAAHLTYNILV